MLADVWAFVTAHPFIVGTIAIALVFDFTNGFHDSANAIATVVATKVMTPAQALVMAAAFNFIGPFVFGLAVAATVGKGIINVSVIPAATLPTVIFAAVGGAIVWNLITWYVGLPSSSSHSLVGGLIGAGLAALGPAGIVMPKWAEAEAIGRFVLAGALGGLAAGVVMLVVSRARLPKATLAPLSVVGALGLGVLFVRATPLPILLSRAMIAWTFHLTVAALLGAFIAAILWMVTQKTMSVDLLPSAIGFGIPVALVLGALNGTLVLSGITKTVLFMVVSPVLGFLAGFLLMSLVTWVVQGLEPGPVAVGSKRLQMVSAAFYALTHGTNDAQKTMGVIGVLLIAGGATAASGTLVPTWVIIASATAMGLGTLFGGWRIINTMASKITHLNPAQGFAASAAGGVVLAGMADAGIPVSTTHAISGSIMGVGATRGASAVRWGVGRRIVGAWVLTIPAAAIVAFVAYYVVRGVTGG
jgi:PiT family inorganic phosphate transporter